MKKREITEIEEIKQIEIGILDHVVEICKKYHLKYFLAYGTLLGAVRHQGFIPWDDDIDIYMPRPDYEKLCDVWNNEAGIYELMECSRNPKYVYSFAKVVDKRTILFEKDVKIQYKMGIYIDIFPYDGLKGGPEKNKRFLQNCENLEKLRSYAMFSKQAFAHENAVKNIGRQIGWYMLKLLGAARLARILNKKAQRDRVEESDWVGCMATRHYTKEMMPKEWFEEEMDLLFEGKYYKVPKEYDKILKTGYGDYMQLPPEEERVPYHGFKAWKVVEG